MTRPRARLRKPHKPGQAADIEIVAESEGALARMFGTDERAVADLIYGQVLNILHHDKTKALDDRVVDLASALVAELKPKDTVEALLVAQMLAAHVGAMDCVRRGLQSDGYHRTAQTFLGLGGRLMRTFTGQLEALNHGRGLGTVQRVVVEKVNVEAGGQAVVGAVTTPGGRGA